MKITAAVDQEFSTVDRAKSQIIRLMSVFVVSVGILCRICQALQDRCLWLDEAMLALNVDQLSYSELCGPLKRDQAAPVAFLWIQKTAAIVIPDKEIAARIFPMIAGCCSVLFCWSSLRIAGYRPWHLLALSAFSCSPTLIAYAGEGKQYSIDVLVSAIAIWLGVRWMRFPGKSSFLAAAAFSVMSPWFSHIAVFFFPGIFLLALTCPEKINWKATISVALATLISVQILYLISLRHIRGNGFLTRFWSGDYIPLHDPSGTLRWLMNKSSECLARVSGLAPYNVSEPVAWLWLVIVTSTCMWMAFASTRQMLQREPILLVYLTTPIVISLLASLLRAYPFGNRLILFSSPIVFFLLSCCPEGLKTRSRSNWCIDSLIAAVILSYPFASVCDALTQMRPLENAFAPHCEEDIRPFVTKICMDAQNGVPCFVFHAVGPSFELYAGDEARHDCIIFGEPGSPDSYHEQVLKVANGCSRSNYLFGHTAAWGFLETELAYEWLFSAGAVLTSFPPDDVTLFCLDRTHNNCTDSQKEIRH